MRVVHCVHEVCTHYCGRASSYARAKGSPLNYSVLGNPNLVTDKMSLRKSLKLYAKRIFDACEKKSGLIYDCLLKIPEDAILGCFCYPNECHCDIIVEAKKYISKRETKIFKRCPVILPYDELGDASTDTKRIYVTPEGNQYPSITTVLGSISKEGIDAWQKAVGELEAERVLHHACTRGSALHDVVERYIKNESDPDKGCMPNVKLLFKSIKGLLDKSVDIIWCQETPLYSDTLKVAGRVDLIAEYDGQLSIIDFKTARRRKSREEIDCYFQQTAAYAIMFEELTGIPIHNIVILMAVDNSPTPIIFKEKTKDWVKPLYDTIESYYTLNI